jgi:hypothetical protein
MLRFSVVAPPALACFGPSPAGCTRRWPHAITVVASQYHMHQIGASLVTRHLRGGLELPPLRQRRYWDFEYQVSWLPDGMLCMRAADRPVSLSGSCQCLLGTRYIAASLRAGICWPSRASHRHHHSFLHSCCMHFTPPIGAELHAHRLNREHPDPPLGTTA